MSVRPSGKQVWVCRGVAQHFKIIFFLFLSSFAFTENKWFGYWWSLVLSNLVWIGWVWFGRVVWYSKVKIGLVWLCVFWFCWYSVSPVCLYPPKNIYVLWHVEVLSCCTTMRVNQFNMLICQSNLFKCYVPGILVQFIDKSCIVRICYHAINWITPNRQFIVIWIDIVLTSVKLNFNVLLVHLKVWKCPKRGCPIMM